LSSAREEEMVRRKRWWRMGEEETLKQAWKKDGKIRVKEDEFFVT